MRQKKMDEATHMKKYPRSILSSLYSDILLFLQLSQPLVLLRLQVGILMYKIKGRFLFAGCVRQFVYKTFSCTYYSVA